MSIHRIQLTELERTGLINHGLAVGSPSQLSDVFRHGMKWATDNSVMKWISVNDQLPPVGERCLFYMPLAEQSGDSVVAVKTAMKNGQPCWPNTVPNGEDPCNPSNGDCHVTHWMPLPSAPEQNK